VQLDCDAVANTSLIWQRLAGFGPLLVCPRCPDVADDRLTYLHLYMYISYIDVSVSDQRMESNM